MTAMTELARVRTKLIHRMPGGGDLWVFVEAGAMFLIAKPFTPDAFREVIEPVLA